MVKPTLSRIYFLVCNSDLLFKTLAFWFTVTEWSNTLTCKYLLLINCACDKWRYVHCILTVNVEIQGCFFCPLFCYTVIMLNFSHCHDVTTIKFFCTNLFHFADVSLIWNSAECTTKLKSFYLNTFKLLASSYNKILHSLPDTRKRANEGCRTICLTMEWNRTVKN